MKFIAIRENHLYRKAYNKGGRKSTSTCTVFVLRDKAASLLRKQNPLKEKVNRIGISASKKVGGAVQRNRAKRVIREAYRQIDKNIGVKKGFLIVICPKPECTVCKMQTVLRDMKYALRSLDMLENRTKQGSASEENTADTARAKAPTPSDASCTTDTADEIR